jgi:nucleotide-binding universal stress UspA family protein
VAGEGAIAFPIEEYDEAMASFAKAALQRVEAKAKAADVACTVKHIRDEFPAEGIVKSAQDNGCDLIVMSSHGRRGLSRLLLGSQATKVLTHSTIPVLICR